MPTSTQIGNGARYLPRSQFKQQSVVEVDVDSLPEVESRAIRRPPTGGGGPSTLCKVLTGLAALCVIGAGVGTALALTIGTTTTTTTTATTTTTTTSTTTSATTTTSTTSTTTTSTTTTTTTSTTTTTTTSTTTTTTSTTSTSTSTTSTSTTSTTSTSTTSTTSTSTTSTTSTSTTSTTATTTTTTGLQALSLLATVTSSSFWSGAGSASAQGDGLVDRSQSTSYNAGGYAPQYVQLELPGYYTISRVCLLIGQAPNGNTLHQLSVGSVLGSLSVATTLNGYTYGGQWVNLTYSPVLTNIRYLRLDSLSSPSWIAWGKFLVYGL